MKLALVAATALLAALLLSQQYVAGVTAQGVLEDNSFKPGFDEYDGLGARSIPNWRYGGSTVVNYNFVRLTPDRASKRGWLWNEKPMATNDWSVTMRFRVSGQGRTLFGDGIALWFTTDSSHKDGSLHGNTDTYTGFGVLFDTFKNTESGHVHKDVSVMVNNGTPVTQDGLVIHDGEPVGCDADFRFHEGRDDFNVLTAKSAVKVSYRAGKISITIDPRNTGEFQECVSNYAVELPAGWAADGGYLGITASTGQLADNHDILSVLASSQDVVVEEKPAAPNANRRVTSGSKQVDDAIAAAVAKAIAPLEEDVSTLHHHVEHQLESIHDTTENTIGKIRDQEADIIRRLEELEARLADRMADEVGEKVNSQVGDAVASTLEDRLRSLESVMKRDMDAKMKSEVGSQLDSVKSMVESSGGGWMLPFLVLALCMAAVVAVVAKTYKDAKKSHLL